MTNLSLHHYPYCSRIVLIEGLSQTLGRSQLLCLFTKKGTNRSLIIIDQSPCYLFLEKYLKESFSIQFLSTLKRITYLVLISLGSDLMILENINFLQYCMKFINLLIVINQKMSGVFSWIFQKHLIQSGMMDSSIKLNVLASQATP